MITHHRDAFIRAASIAERDQIHPFSCMRQETGDVIWLVQSRSEPSCYYLPTVSGDDVSCTCPQAQHHGICAHAAAVHLALQAEPQQSITSSYPLPIAYPPKVIGNVVQ